MRAAPTARAAGSMCAQLRRNEIGVFSLNNGRSRNYAFWPLVRAFPARQLNFAAKSQPQKRLAHVKHLLIRGKVLKNAQRCSNGWERVESGGLRVE